MVSLIIPAAGQSRRFNATSADVPRKPFALLAGQPVVARTLRQFAQVPDILQVILAVAKQDIKMAEDVLADVLKGFKNHCIIAGGAERPDTVAAALDHLDPACQLVAIHDAARPLISPDIIRRAIASAARRGAAVVAVPICDTVKCVSDDCLIERTISRSKLWVAQTPQVFRREVIIDAYRRRHSLRETITDDAQLVEAIGQSVAVVEGSPANLKITTPEDLRRAEALLKAGLC